MIELCRDAHDFFDRDYGVDLFVIDIRDRILCQESGKSTRIQTEDAVEVLLRQEDTQPAVVVVDALDHEVVGLIFVLFLQRDRVAFGQTELLLIWRGYPDLVSVQRFIDLDVAASFRVTVHADLLADMRAVDRLK